jgi:hypothetical protein
VKAGAETDGGVGGVDADDAHGAVVVGVGGDDDVDVLNDALERLVEVFRIQLQSVAFLNFVFFSSPGRHDTQHNDIQHNDI